MSQTQSISNLCFQRALEITHQLSGLNNATRTIKFNGETLTETVGKPVPDNVKALLLEKAKLHSAQAFLIESIKWKDTLIKSKQNQQFNITDTEIIVPDEVTFESAVVLRTVNESWGWEQLTTQEYNEYLEADAYAAHIGQFIHKGSTLDTLRKELPLVKVLEWMSIEDGKKIPITAKVHHDSAKLLATHEDLAAEHRKHEQRVNYFKAKVMNLVADENARIFKANAVEQARVNELNFVLRQNYDDAYKLSLGEICKAQQEFESKRETEVKALAALRINVDARFKETIDTFLAMLDSEA